MDKELNDLFSSLTDEEIAEISDIELNCPIDEITVKRIQTSVFRKAGLMDEEKKTEKKIKKPNTWKKTAVAAACIIIMLTIFSTTGLAQYVSDLWTSKVTIGDGNEEIILNEKVGLIHIKDDAPKKNAANITLKQAEDMIGIDFLDSAMYTSDLLNYNPIVPRKELESLYLWYPACVVYGDDKYISGDYRLFTDKASKSVIPNEDVDAAGGKKLLRTYNSSNLNTTVIIYGVDWSKARITAVFDYNNVHYSFIGNNVSETEMMEFISTLK